MPTIYETVSKDDESSLKVTNESEDRKMNDGKEIKEKLEYYESQCHRYGLQKVKMIQNCIRELPGTANFNLQHYSIGSLQCQVMFESFSKPPVTQLTSISLKNNELESFCCHRIASFVKISATLKELILDGCKFNIEGATILSEGISIAKSIEKLSLANCHIPDDGVETIAKAFLTNKVCRDLDLSSNFISLKTAKAFEEVLTENKTLEKLNLSYNALYQDDAIIFVLRGLMKNDSLHHLDISWNSLCGEGLSKILAKSIRQSKLKVLNIEHNRLSTPELTKLALGLKFSKTIEEVYVADNLIFDEDDYDLLRVFKSKSPLTLMSFGPWFHLSRSAFELLQDTLIVKPFIKVIFKNVILPNPPRDVNMIDILADRAKFLAMKPKKKNLKRNMGAFMHQLKNLDKPYLPKSDFIAMLKVFKAKLNEELIQQYITACSDEQKRLNVHLMANHYLNRHPYTPPAL